LGGCKRGELGEREGPAEENQGSTKKVSSRGERKPLASRGTKTVKPRNEEDCLSGCVYKKSKLADM